MEQWMSNGVDVVEDGSPEADRLERFRAGQRDVTDEVLAAHLEQLDLQEGGGGRRLGLRAAGLRLCQLENVEPARCGRVQRPGGACGSGGHRRRRLHSW